MTPSTKGTKAGKMDYTLNCRTGSPLGGARRRGRERLLGKYSVSSSGAPPACVQSVKTTNNPGVLCVRSTSVEKSLQTITSKILK